MRQSVIPRYNQTTGELEALHLFSWLNHVHRMLQQHLRPKDVFTENVLNKSAQTDQFMITLSVRMVMMI